MKVWVTRWALTKGIKEVEVREVVNGAARGYRVFGPSKYSVYYYPGEWCETRPLAVEKADAMRLKEIASLTTRLAKLEAMSFDD